MNLLPSIASCSSHITNIADLFTKPISRHRFDTLIGDAPTIAASTTSVVSTPSVATATVVAAATSDSFPTLHPNLDLAPTLPFVLDTGASIAHPDFALAVSQAPYGLIRSAFDSSVISDSKFNSVIPTFKASSEFASTPFDPYTLITGEDTAIDLSFPDSDLDLVDTVEFASTLVYSSFRHFGTATLVFLTDANSKLISILVEPTQVDWIHWVPLPRLTPTESYFHIFGLDYSQAFALFHLIPIWIALVSALLRSN